MLLWTSVVSPKSDKSKTGPKGRLAQSRKDAKEIEKRKRQNSVRRCLSLRLGGFAREKGSGLLLKQLSPRI
jgi:hypothetical protein